MFSRSTAPAAWVSGNDSIGRHTRCCSMRDSAWAGVSSDIRLNVSRRARASRSGGLLLRAVLGLPRAQLLVEALGDFHHFLHGGVVHLVLLLLHLRLLVGGGIGVLGEARVELGLDAAEVAVHVRVVL